MSEFKSKVVLVTGAGRGIGRALAMGFARAGASVAVNDLAPGGLDKTVEAIRSEGGTTEAYVADVANKMQVELMIEDIRDAFGRIDILINNAGVEPHASLLELDEYDWDRTLAVNLKGPFLTMQSVARVMADEGGGVVVNVASIAGRSHGLKDRAAYVASKTGLIGLTREAARELAAYGVRVNAVCPGVIETEMTATLRQDEAMMARWLADIPQGRLGKPEDVVVNGQAINVDGGKVMN